jgi:simple sugar transport system permease protein
LVRGFATARGNSNVKAFRHNLPLLVTGVIFCVLFGAAAFFYDGFFSARVVVNLLADNAALGIAAVGMTLVIFSGGIDLSVGAVVGFTSIFTATLVTGHGFSPTIAWALALLLGTALGAGMGALIQVFRLPPFLTTLAGMFFARGMAFQINTESVGITNALYDRLANFDLALGNAIHLSAAALILLAVVLAGYLVAHQLRFGRTLLAVGGSEHSAVLMGLPVGASKISVYALNGFCAALAGIVATLYTSSGNAITGGGLELDAIAVVVIGGTLLSGGRGHMLGTLLGVLIFGTIQAAILFDGRLSSWWMRIVVGALLLAFILLQRFLIRGVARRG